MTLEEFLDRVIAPGAYLATAYQRPGSKFTQKFFPRLDISNTAKFLRAESNYGDTWFAPASFNAKSRRQTSACEIKAFWADADIVTAHSPHGFASDAEVVQWVAAFTRATAIPRPNIFIKSGYGVHLYWSFEDPLDLGQWRPYAEALKTLMVQHGFKGDTSVTGDAVRVLRPPETQNHKVPATPVPAYEIAPGKLTLPDYQNSVLLPAILAQQPQAVGLSAPPPSFTTGSGSSLAAAKAGITSAPRDFEIVSQNCAQLAQSLAAGGNGDKRDLWWRWITLATFCMDGRDWAHKVGEGDPRYVPADTDHEYDQALAEHGDKGFGPPSCAKINADRPGICPSCPHYNTRVTTPYHVGLQVIVPGDPNELPLDWRRENGWIEHYQYDRTQKKFLWRQVVEGDVTEPILDDLDGTYRLTFCYTPPNNPPRTIYIDNVELNARTAKTVLSARGMHTDDDRAPNLCRLMMSWIDKLQRELRIRSYPVPSFGWYKEGSRFAGFSVGGTCYLAGGAEADAPGADRTLISRYQPVGDLAKWRNAAEFVASDCAELHTMVAMSFGAPLMSLQGGSGAVLSFVGVSGIGKTAATHAGQSVWADPIKASFSVDDTENYKIKAISDIRAMPVYWDEAKADDEIRKLVNEIHKFTQGRDKGRLMQDTKVRESGDWSTLYGISTNDSIRDLIAGAAGDTDATLLRVLEIRVERTAPAYNPKADKIVSSLRDNRGVAGQVYARYLADHSGLVVQLLERIKALIDRRVTPTTNERFYVAAATATVAGATIARKLGLIQLDTGAILDVLIGAIRKSRKVRDELQPANPLDNLAARIDEYITAYRHECLISDTMANPGPTSKSNPKPNCKVVPVAPPKEGMGVAYHIAAADKVVRINAKVWRSYWNSKRVSPSKLREEVIARWGLPNHSARGIGRGTSFSSEWVYAFSLNLNTDLEFVAAPWAGSTTGSVAANVIPLRP